MRLICPNCGAQYDVDDGVVPDNGRDVQCSNCGHTWFQRPAHKDKELSEELGTSIHDAEIQQDTAETAQEHADSDLHEQTPPENVQETEDQAEDQHPKRRELDTKVADILRQEAELETAERQSEGSALETQPDLGLDDQDNAAAKERMARLRGLSDDDALDQNIASAAAMAARKDLLPDIEEINSTLTASSDRVGEETSDEYQEKRARSGFRRGFSISILIFVILMLIYVFAAKIVALVPALGPVLNAYVEWVNQLRVAIDGVLQKAVEKLTVLVSQLGNNE